MRILMRFAHVLDSEKTWAIEEGIRGRNSVVWKRN